MLREKVNHKVIKTLLPGVLCFFILLGTSCQKDDICPASTEVTPRLNIAFFDLVEQDIPKAPVNLRVRNIDFDTLVVFRGNAAEISIPLRTDVDITRYEFILNSPPNEDDPPAPDTNVDNVTFSYTREEIYLNRACGYIVNYQNLSVVVQGNDSRWINSYLVATQTIENETDIHISIFH